MVATLCSLNSRPSLNILSRQPINRKHASRSSFKCGLSDGVTRQACFSHFSQRLLFKRETESPVEWNWHEKQKDSVRTRAGNAETGHDQNPTDDVSRATLIWRAIKLRIYSVAFVPLTVGSAAAYFEIGIFSAKQYFLLLASSMCIIAWLNLSNDVYDFDTGADKDKKESVVNLAGSGSRTATFFAAYVLLAVGFLGLSLASLEAANTRSILLLFCAIICGFIYQCPPFRLSYQGLGEPLCLAAFGPFATTAFYLMQCGRSEIPINGTILSASLLVGITTSLILFCSHFHQVEGDKAVGKNSPLVRLGTKSGAEVLRVAVVLLYSLLFIFGLCRALPLPSILFCALTIPIGKLVVSYVEENHKDKTKIFMAKYYCVILHALFGAALATGLVFCRLLRGRIFPLLF